MIRINGILALMLIGISLDHKTVSAAPLFDPPDEVIPWTIDVGQTRQLFMDNRLIAESHNISVVMTRPEKYEDNPVLKADQPWEQGSYGNFKGVMISPQCILYDEQDKLFKIWYSGWIWEPAKREGKKKVQPWCYAVSKDGYHWEKPALGLVEFEQSRENNIVMFLGDETFWSVIKTPHDPDPQRLYKAFGEIEPKGQPEKHGACVAFSPDGLHWTLYENNPVIHKGPDFADGSSVMGWDPRINKYVAYLRTGRPSTRPTRGSLVRSVGYSTSDDFIHWNPMKMMLMPNDKDRVDTEYEMFSGCFDPRTCYYLGLTHLRQSTGFEVYLMSSRDGFRWTWIDRYRPLIGFEEGDGFLHCGVFASGPVLHDDKVWLYYQEYKTFFDSTKEAYITYSTIGLATLPLDRYVGLIGGIHTGRVITRALTFEGNTLLIDVDGAFPDKPDKRGNPESALVRVGLLDHRSEPIPGFTLEDCQPITSSGVQTVQWAGGSLDSLPEEHGGYTNRYGTWPGIKRRI